MYIRKRVFLFVIYKLDINLNKEKGIIFKENLMFYAWKRENISLFIDQNM